MSVISVQNLVKNYKAYKKEPGFFGAVKSLYSRNYELISAVSDVSFEIEEGELVGFIGPNGAGKTTTLKCLSGLLYPSRGKVNVLGFDPWKREDKFLKQISLIMGQKNQLWWDLPPIESFLLNKEIYGIPDKQFKETLLQLSELLDIEDVLNVQVRKLSLGQRMKCELVAAILHNPRVLFLDEPTIGLDVVMQKNLRDFIREFNGKYNSTVILTSHYMEDVKQLCKRVIIIDHGKLLFDGNLSDIIKKYATKKFIKVLFEKDVERKEIEKFGKIHAYKPAESIIAVNREDAPSVAAEMLKQFVIEDINIEEPDIEDVIRDVFTNK